jgi:outer membrane protein assembly factor BamD
MKKNWLIQFFGILFICFALYSCKSDFETIRTSGDPKLLYKKAMEYYQKEDYQRAQTLLELLVSSVRGTKEAEEVYFKYAYSYFYLENYVLASYYFNNFVNTFGGSALREEAEFMSAFSHYKLAPNFRLDQTYSQKAIDELESFVNTHPESARVKECNSLIDELRAKQERKNFEAAKLYYNLRYYQAAMQAYENVIKDFPETARAEEVRYLIMRSSYLLAQNSVLEKREDRYKQCLKFAEEFIERYPKSEYFDQAKTFQVDSKKQLKILSNNVRYQNQGTRTGS